MATNLSIPQPCPPCPDHQAADNLARELNDLIKVIVETWGCSWSVAVEIALAQFADLIEYAEEWDVQARQGGVI